MIHIKVSENQPQYFGNTGVHLYAVKSMVNESEIHIEVDATSKAIDLYKLYHDLAVFLSNSTDILPMETDVRTFGVYGNSEYFQSIQQKDNEAEGYQIVGYLNQQDVEKTVEFLTTNSLDKKRA
ncbi:MAG: hypothetical protein ACI9XO_003351 [Paraglaciecola sp.]|jgi:hypothetical protein